MNKNDSPTSLVNDTTKVKEPSFGEDWNTLGDITPFDFDTHSNSAQIGTTVVTGIC